MAGASRWGARDPTAARPRPPCRGRELDPAEGVDDDERLAGVVEPGLDGSQDVVQPLAQRRVGMGLDEVGAGEVEDAALAVGEVALVGQREADQQPRRCRQCDRELVLDAERHEDLLVELALAEGRMVDDVREPVRARVARLQVALHERVLVAEAPPVLQPLRGGLRRDDRDQRRAVGGDLVVGGVGVGDDARDHVQQRRAKRREILGVVDLAEDLEQPLQLAFRQAVRQRGSRSMDGELNG